MRTVKRQTLELNKNKIDSLTKLTRSYANEKRYWLDLLRGWDYQALLGNPRKIRDEFVHKGYTSGYGLQARHWKLALQDAVETWDKYWQAIFVQVRVNISRSSMSEAERHYAYWLLKGYSQFAELMQGKVPQPPFEIPVEACHKVAAYVRRTVRNKKGNTPRVRKSRIVKFDANCYEVFEQDGRQYIKLMTLERGERLCLPLSGKAKIEGTITVVFAGDRAVVHVPNELKPKAKKEGPTVAVDFGYTEVLTDAEGVRYGKQFGEILTKTSDDLHKTMQKRHKLHALEKKQRTVDTKIAKRCRKYNLGKQKLLSKKKAAKASLEREINTAINDLVQSKNPSILITEDLSHVFTYEKSKAVNRKQAAWLRGTIQERISFKALAEGFRHEQVNPAYGSQTCPCCDFVDHRNRKKDRFTCVHCKHEDIADRVAAENYARRFGDQEIELSTPYSQVKTILLGRFHRRLEMGQPMTVQGRTLETVNLVHPPPFRDDNKVIAGRVKSSKTGRSIRERNTVNTF